MNYEVNQSFLQSHRDNPVQLHSEYYCPLGDSDTVHYDATDYSEYWACDDPTCEKNIKCLFCTNIHKICNTGCLSQMQQIQYHHIFTSAN